MSIKLDIKLDWPSYEDDIQSAIRDEILQCVRAEVRKHSKDIRAEVSKAIIKNQKSLIDVAMKSIDKLKRSQE